MKLKTGKLPPNLLNKFLRSLPRDPRVVRGPLAGEDAAVVKLGDGYLVIASDPVTFTAKDPGYYTVVVNANDVAATGARPEYLLATVLLPGGIEEISAHRVLDQIRDACKAFDITLIGGHTEITHDLPRPIVSGTCLGFTRRPLPSGGVSSGDVILQIKPTPIEAISLIAREKETELREDPGEEAYHAARDCLTDPGISIVREALLLKDVPGVTALHDVTEGGIHAALLEMASASGLRFELEKDAVLIHPLWERVGKRYGLDPFTCIGSGCLLAAVRKEERHTCGEKLEREGVPHAVLGRAVPGSGVLLSGKAISYPENDGITAIF